MCKMNERIEIFRELNLPWCKVEYSVYDFRINQNIYHNIQMSFEVWTVVIKQEDRVTFTRSQHILLLLFLECIT